MKILLRKRPGSLWPADEVSENALKRIADKDVVICEIKRTRNIKFHRLYWALVGKVWDNVDHERYPTADDLHAAIKIAVGLRTRIVLPDGTLGFIPGSIAFHKMTEDEFRLFYDRVCDMVAEYFLPGVTADELRNEVRLMVGAG